LVRLSLGTQLPRRELPGGEELFVVSGSCGDDRSDYGQWTWIRQPIGEASPLFARNECHLFIKRGHLVDPPSPPT
jgi:hypothetical protein